MQVRLKGFIKTVQKYERCARREPAFWKARDSLGNYLSGPVNPVKTGRTVKRFLGIWKSYRGRIGWTSLAKLWTPDLQRIAHSLSGIHIEDARIEELYQACRLYECLIQVQGVGGTNASKMLALGLPDLCVMWDGNIGRQFRKGYQPRPASVAKSAVTSGISRDALLYLEFLGKQKGMADSLIVQCMHQERLDRSGAISWLQNLPLREPNSVVRRPKSLAKMLDQYNYYRRS